MNKTILSVISSFFFICSVTAEVIKDVQVIGKYYYGPNISDNQACEYAKENAKINKVDNRIDFKESNWFCNLNEEKYDYIVSNPPYLSKENSQYYQNLADPENSLYSKKRGVHDIFEIMKNCRKFMKKKSFLIIEHSHNQTLEIKSFSFLKGLNFINVEKDELGFNRISIFSNFIK